MAQTASANAEIFEPETSGHQHPRTEISRNIGRGTEISRMTSAAVTTPPHNPTARTSRSTARTSRSAAAPVKVFTVTILNTAIVLTFPINPRSSALTFINAVVTVVQLIICSLALLIFNLSREFILILSRGFMLILSRGIILIRGVSSSSAPEAESSAPANAATANADATASSVDAVLDGKQLVPIIISVLGTFMSIVAASLMLDKDVSHSIRDLGLAVFYLQLLAMICLLVGMGIKQLLGTGIKQQLRQLLFVAGIVMASVSVLLMVVFISLVFIVASK